MILFGASGHGKVIIDILESMHEPHIVIWDDADKEPLWEYSVLKPTNRDSVGELIIIGIGVNATRKKIAERFGESFGFGIATHSRAYISGRATVGAGTVIMAGATINPDAVIGRHCIINTSASIDHDCVLGDYVHISPNATLSGDVQVGEGTHIGSGACVIQGIRIGKWCTIGAGAVIIKDIPDNATAVGNPSRIIKVKEQQ
jgi:sugar O-acyltransferase (sialic acid O-acetyltransferase NeuD family)